MSSIASSGSGGYITRLRPAGSFSRLKFSPRQNRMGGVERSTSRTNPGRAMGSAFSHVERDLHRAAASGRGCVCDRVLVVVERIGGRHEAAELETADDVDGGREVVAGVRITAADGSLAVPQRRQFER